MHNRFGGTDGKYYYNDTWCFDSTTSKWSELSCIGFIPSSREGHTAAFVDDVMYIFGGRGVDGHDLGDLAAFKVSSERSSLSYLPRKVYKLAVITSDQRWYMFQNMGPAPSARSGHAMVAVGQKLFILGGEASGQVQQEHTDSIHVLDTSAYRPSMHFTFGMLMITYSPSSPLHLPSTIWLWTRIEQPSVRFLLWQNTSSIQSQYVSGQGTKTVLIRDLCVKYLCHVQ